jgi:hypothetical protein
VDRNPNRKYPGIPQHLEGQLLDSSTELLLQGEGGRLEASGSSVSLHLLLGYGTSGHTHIGFVPRCQKALL